MESVLNVLIVFSVVFTSTYKVLQRICRNKSFTHTFLSDQTWKGKIQWTINLILHATCPILLSLQSSPTSCCVMIGQHEFWVLWHSSSLKYMLIVLNLLTCVWNHVVFNGLVNMSTIWFGECTCCNLIISSWIFFFSYEMTIQFYMFCPLMINWICGFVNSCLIITI